MESRYGESSSPSSGQGSLTDQIISLMSVSKLREQETTSSVANEKTVVGSETVLSLDPSEIEDKQKSKEETRQS